MKVPEYMGYCGISIGIKWGVSAIVAAETLILGHQNFTETGLVVSTKHVSYDLVALRLS